MIRLYKYDSQGEYKDYPNHLFSMPVKKFTFDFALDQLTYENEVYRVSTIHEIDESGLSTAQVQKESAVLQVPAGGVQVVFSRALGASGTDYTLTYSCYNVAGDIVAVAISNRSKDGFHVLPAEAAIFEYQAFKIV